MGNWSGCQRQSETERMRWGGGGRGWYNGGYLEGGREGNKNRITDKNKEKEVEWDRNSGGRHWTPAMSLSYELVRVWWHLGAKINIFGEQNGRKQRQKFSSDDCAYTFLKLLNDTINTLTLNEWHYVIFLYYYYYFLNGNCYVTISSSFSNYHGSKRGSVEDV